MKDKKWLLEQLENVEQLDEPKKPAEVQEVMDWLDDLWRYKTKIRFEQEYIFCCERDLEVLKERIGQIGQVKVPEKPVIPQFVAEYIELANKYDYNVYGAMRAVHDPHRFEDITATEQMKQWLACTHHDVFARAWLDGYEVEQEKRYVIKMPLTGCVLALWEQENEWEFMRPDEIAGNSEWKSQFTEAEIKAIDPKYIAFAEEVRE